MFTNVGVCGPDDVICRYTDGRAANRAAAAAARLRLDLPIYRQGRGLIEAADGEGEQTGWRCDFLRSEQNGFPGSDSLPFDGTIRFFL